MNTPRSGGTRISQCRPSEARSHVQVEDEDQQHTSQLQHVHQRGLKHGKVFGSSTVVGDKVDQLVSTYIGFGALLDAAYFGGERVMSEAEEFVETILKWRRCSLQTHI